MKELTYEEWIKNPTPRMMWCWDKGWRFKSSHKSARLTQLIPATNKRIKSTRFSLTNYAQHIILVNVTQLSD